jgi:hypothetical protein
MRKLCNFICARRGVALLGARPLSQDLLLLLGPKNSKVLLFPYREICTHRFSSARSPFLDLSEDRNSRLRKFSVDHWALESPRPDMSVNADFLFPLSGLRLYRDFATRDTKHSVLQPPIPMCRNSDMLVS